MVTYTDRKRQGGAEMSAGEHHASRLPAARARQAVPLGHVRYVLGIGLALIVVALAVIYALYF